jgi:ribosome-binding factor A
MGQKGTERTDRVGQQIHEVLASLFLFEVEDPRLQKVQLTGVEVTGDLRIANVYYVVIDRESPEPEESVRKALDRSTGFLRKMLGDRLRMKHTPELRFHYDESIARGRRIEALLEEVGAGEQE